MELLQKDFKKLQNNILIKVSVHLNQFLIQGGLNLMSQPSTGSTLGDIATAAKAPTAQLLKDLSARGQLRKKLALEGEVMDIESEQAEKLLQEKIF
jgi:hypothetical protein